MLSIQQCKTILNKNNKEELTDAQVEEIKVFLELVANTRLETYQNRNR